ncbi:uncharacterized protein LOC141595173 [Silene latifolia]|uniref:uncharacterized protein LOC141595173 n=1 Tax=Silene latifolia TaxID=37657 RepID=UPI003D772F0C
MKVSSWNIRGCNDPLKLQEIKDFLWVNKLDILGVLETKIKQRNYGRIISSYLTLGSCCNLEPRSNGRILLLWNVSTVVVTPIQVHPQFMHCEVFHNATCQVFHITFVYASNDARERDGLWTHLLHIKPLVDKRLILGDFNVIRDISEKIGGTLPDLADIMDFNSCLYQCEVEDLNSSGCDFSSWNVPVSGSSTYKLFAKLKNVRKSLRLMHKEHFTSISIKVQGLKQELKDCQMAMQADNFSPDLISKEKELLSLYCKFKHIEKNIAQQQAKVHNIIHDDCSSKFFYAKIQERKQQQIIGQIKDRHGTDKIGQDNVAAGFVDYYQSLLGASSPVSPLDTDFIQLSPTVSREAADILILPITNEEIKTALFTIGSDKSPGPDGFSSAFFKHSWPLIGETFCKAVHSFFSTGRMSKQANSTLLALIPKKKVSSTVMDFRPISCCTTFYKTVSKIISTRLSTVLPLLVGPEQAAFVKGRSIHENIMLSQSLVKGYGRKYLTPRCLIKVDIRKAFDSLQWSFIENMLTALKFPPQFISWIMGCLTSSWISIKLNGSVHGFFQGKSGVRQGDPLSPYIFVLSMEILSRYLRCLNSHPQVSLHPKCSKMKLTHLIFADDLMVFIRGDVPSVQAVSQTLNLFPCRSSWFGLASPTGVTIITGSWTDVCTGSPDDIGNTHGIRVLVWMAIPLVSFLMLGVLLSRLSQVVSEFLSMEIYLKSARFTLLVLIPKKVIPNSIDFRPHSLFTTFYKVVSKVLANRLVGVMEDIIGPEQQATFVKHRDLFENSMLAHELSFKYSRSLITPRCLLKVDIQKAFDSVHWDFLKNSLISLGFPAKFVLWLMACVSSPTYSISINGSTEGILLPKGVIKSINKLCKDFLWGIDTGQRRHVFKSWKSLCMPKQEGGMGIMDISSWNMSQMVSWIWKLVYRPRSLWARWTQHYILKASDIWQAKASPSFSWYWHNVLAARNHLLNAAGSPSQALNYLQTCTHGQKFQCSAYYDLIRDRGAPLSCWKLLHSAVAVPKHRFISLLAIQDCLPTVESCLEVPSELAPYLIHPSYSYGCFCLVVSASFFGYTASKQLCSACRYILLVAGKK